MNTVKAPVRNLEYRTEGTPTSTVSISASANPSPTGIKSQADWEFIANSAGNAKCGGIFPFPISTPIKTPTTWAITAPGPRNGDKKGNEHTKEIKISPPIELVNGLSILAKKSPIPVSNIIPIIMDTKAIKGKIVFRTVSIAYLPDW